MGGLGVLQGLLEMRLLEMRLLEMRLHLRRSIVAG